MTATPAPAPDVLDLPLLPRRRRGRQTPAAEAEYQVQRRAFCRLILEIRSMDFRVSSRGWCYILEQHSLPKGDFNAAQALITDCRKTGDLPLDICAEDDARKDFWRWSEEKRIKNQPAMRILINVSLISESIISPFRAVGRS